MSGNKKTIFSEGNNPLSPRKPVVRSFLSDKDVLNTSKASDISEMNKTSKTSPPSGMQRTSPTSDTSNAIKKPSRVNIAFTNDQLKNLKLISRLKGLSMSEYINQVVDMDIQAQKEHIEKAKILFSEVER